MPLPVPDSSLFFICRHCETMAAAWDAGERVCRADCGGPLKGRGYPQYRGPLTQAMRVRRCFVCGDPAQSVISIKGVVMVGVCERHLPFARPDLPIPSMKPEDRGVATTRKVEVPPEELFGLGGKKE